jgi:hypothetical protein
MNDLDLNTEQAAASAVDGAALMRSLVQAPAAVQPQMLPSVALAKLLALNASDDLALVQCLNGGEVAPAVWARTTVGLRGAHIGHTLTLVFENGDPQQPIVTGVLRGGGVSCSLSPAQVELQADGARMVVSAQTQLVLRCGTASITLDKSGRIDIRGATVVTHADGVNRLRGGSVQLN